MRNREAEHHAQGHTASNRQGQDLQQAAPEPGPAPHWPWRLGRTNSFGTDKTPCPFPRLSS